MKKSEGGREDVIGLVPLQCQRQNGIELFLARPGKIVSIYLGGVDIADADALQVPIGETHNVGRKLVYEPDSVSQDVEIIEFLLFIFRGYRPACAHFVAEEVRLYPVSYTHLRAHETRH